MAGERHQDDVRTTKRVPSACADAIRREPRPGPVATRASDERWLGADRGHVLAAGGYGSVTWWAADVEVPRYRRVAGVSRDREGLRRGAHVISAFEPATPPSSEDLARAREDAKTDLDKALEQLTDGVRVHGELIDGSAVDVLHQRTPDLDLLAMGSRAHGPILRAVLGSVSHGVLLDCLCPVLLLPRGAAPLTEAQANAVSDSGH